MPVTELAILRLAPGADLSDATLRAKLGRAKTVMENALDISGRRFVYYQGVEDPRALYLVGGWQSAAEHWGQFIPSPENQELLVLLRDELDIPRIEMYHVDVPNAEIPAEANVLSFEWHRVLRDVDRAAFEARFLECRKWLDEYLSTADKPAGGWRIEKAAGREEEDEWVLFTGWKSVEEYMGFAGTSHFEKYRQIRELTRGFEVKHGIRIQV